MFSLRRAFGTFQDVCLRPYLWVFLLVISPLGSRADAPQTVLVFSSADEAKYPPPTAEKPAFYVAMAGGYHSEGDAVAGRTRDEVLKTEQVWPGIQQALARQHFLPADSKNEPSLLIVFHWGSMLPALTNRIEPENGAPPGFETSYDAKRMGELVGATRSHVWDFDFSDVYGRATDNRYVLVITAFDFAAAKQKKKIVKWRTRISTVMERTTLAEALAPMILTGAPFFGRDSGMGKEIQREAKATAGDLKVIESDVALPVPPKK